MSEPVQTIRELCGHPTWTDTWMGGDADHVSRTCNHCHASLFRGKWGGGIDKNFITYCEYLANRKPESRKP